MASSINSKPLSKEEQEEEEMRKDLEDAGLYENNMGIEEMRSIYNMLNESKSMVEDKSSPPPPPHSNNNSKQYTESESFDNAVSQRPIPSFSYRNALAGSTSASQSISFEEQTSSTAKNSEPNLNKFYSKRFLKEVDTDIAKTEFPALSSKSNAAKKQETKKMTPAQLKKMRLERWKFDPLQCDEDEEKGEPLVAPDRWQNQPEESLLQAREDMDLHSEEFTDLCRQVKEKLEIDYIKYAEYVLSRDIDEWGPPIKVTRGKGSKTDKKSTGVDQPSTSRQETSISARTERATKRKALQTISAVANAEIDENIEDEFVDLKKRKFQQERKSEIIKENHENRKVEKQVEMISFDEEKNLSDLEMFDNPHVRNSRKITNTKTSTNSEPVMEEPEYPKRIVPPVPGKKGNKGPRKNKTSNQSKLESFNKNGLSNDEIANCLDTLDKEIENNDNDNDCIDITDEIKPLPVSRNLKKLHMASTLLKNAHEEEDKRKKVEKEEKEQQKREERIKMDEIVSKRLQEQESKDGKILEKQQKYEKQQDFYKHVLGGKQRVTRSNFQSRGAYEEVDEDALLADDEPIVTHSNIISKSPCPICQRLFPTDQIEAHASECDAFLEQSSESYAVPGPSTSSSSSYKKCGICGYWAKSGIDLEEHVVICRQKEYDRKNGN